MIIKALEILNNRNIDKCIDDVILRQEYLEAVNTINEFVIDVYKIVFNNEDKKPEEE